MALPSPFPRAAVADITDAAVKALCTHRDGLPLVGSRVILVHAELL